MLSFIEKWKERRKQRKMFLYYEDLKSIFHNPESANDFYRMATWIEDNVENEYQEELVAFYKIKEIEIEMDYEIKIQRIEMIRKKLLEE